ncbi:MAG: hypothetical protein ABWY06_23240 [Pseudomonas sp.]|uniref:hypothetical protein n=1 Tax=Pseudomonas sp. TaxID=306 RepID=UPI00339AAF88
MERKTPHLVAFSVSFVLVAFSLASICVVGLRLSNLILLIVGGVQVIAVIKFVRLVLLISAFEIFVVGFVLFAVVVFPMPDGGLPMLDGLPYYVRWGLGLVVFFVVFGLIRTALALRDGKGLPSDDM